MRPSTNFLYVFILCFFLINQSCSSKAMPLQDGQKHSDHMVDIADPVSYAMVDLSTSTPTATQPTGSSTINSVSLFSKSGAIFRQEYNTWSLSNTNGAGLTFDLNLNKPGRVQMAMEVAAALVNGVPHDPIYIKVENSNGSQVVTKKPISDTIPNFHVDVFEIPESALVQGSNKVTLYLTQEASTQLFVKNIKFLPQKIESIDGVLSTTLYTQFGETSINGIPGVAGGKIWTRAYGLDETIEMLPGPTFYFKPGDLLNVNIANRLNPAESDVMQKYEELMGKKFNPDEVLIGDSIRGEINIPHNLNNTNLHVHGLHVDPSKDDVTIVIVPEGIDTAGYDAPHHAHAPVSDLGKLNPFSVSDQSVKPGSWDYQYKIPTTHLPGTHWYHPHKHGSTSAQVENGLAGTIVIQESQSNAIVPFPSQPSSVVGGGNQTPYDLTEWQTYHDRVLAVQELTNFGAQYGKGNSKGHIDSIANPANPGGATNVDIQVTVNGKLMDTLNIRPNQLERWRMVNAGTNHRAFSQIWLGMYEKDTTIANKKNVQKKVKIYKSIPVFLAAVDGITLSKLDTVTAENPALLAPGNRSDFLVQLGAGTYTLFKDYKSVIVSDSGDSTFIAVRQTNGHKILYNSVTNTSSFWPEAAPTKSNPYLFAKVDSSGQNYGEFIQNWNGNKSTSLIPLIKTKIIKDGNFLDVDFATKSEFKQGEVGKWQPYNFNGSITDADLFSVKVSGAPVAANSTPKFPSNTYLKSIAPTTSGNAPSYVSKIKDSDILQSRPVMFDVSGIKVNVSSANGFNGGVNQFTLNGRFFELNDMIGNPKADSIIGAPFTDPSELESPTDQKNKSISHDLSFEDFFAKNYTNKVDDNYYFTNPGYYQSITKKGNAFAYSGIGKPSWSALTGIADTTLTIGTKTVTKSRPSIVNVNSTFYDKNKTLVDSLPLAQTAEEWILINNSDVSHPFHIHINPFFVVEVGQLAYQKYVDADGNTQQDWFMRAVTASDSDIDQRQAMPAKGAVPGTIYQGEIGVDAIVGNWWDTITIPAHGYVKVRYWFNVPNQTGEGASSVVADNFNKTGIWVYHCHILRHEDRGMMMPVITIANDSNK